MLKGWNMIVIFSENSLLYFQNIQEASYIFRIYKKPLISSEYTPWGGATTAATAAAAEELFEQSRSQSHRAQEKIHVSGNPSLRYISNPDVRPFFDIFQHII